MKDASYTMKAPGNTVGLYYDAVNDMVAAYVRYTCGAGSLDFDEMKHNLVKEFMSVGNVPLQAIGIDPPVDELINPPRLSLDSSYNLDRSVTFHLVSRIDDYDSERDYTICDIVDSIIGVIKESEVIVESLSDTLLNKPRVFDVVLDGADGCQYQIKRKKSDLTDLTISFSCDDPLVKEDPKAMKETIMEHISSWLDDHLPDDTTAYHIDVTGQYAVDAWKPIKLEN